MRRTMGICVWIVAGAWVSSGGAMTITGRVVDHKAQPVPGAEVIVGERAPGGDGYDGARTISSAVRTDTQGRFALDVQVMRQRDVFVVARKAGLAYAWEWLNDSANTVSGRHFLLVLEPVCVLAGQVVDAEGKPMAGAEVQALPVNTWGFRSVIRSWEVPGPKPWFTVTTDIQGRFRFDRFAAEVSAALQVQAPGGTSRYVFYLYATGPCRFDAGRSDLCLTLPREGTIRGRVVDDRGQPVNGIGLTICSARQYPDTLNRYVQREVQSDSTGVFAFAGVPEGPHRIEMTAPERELPLWTSDAEKVSVKAGGVAEITIRLSKGGVLEATALDARTRRPLPGAKLEAAGQPSRRNHFARADAKGLARLRVPAGSYTVIVSAPQFSHAQSTVKVVEGQTIRREALLPASPRMSGRILDPQGRPAAGVVVSIHPFGDHVYTDAQGRFEAGRNERYGAKSGLVVARDVKEGWAGVMSIGSSPGPVDVRLGPAWTLTGRVADPNGVGIPAARVALHLSAQNWLSDPAVEALSGPDGRFEMTAIPLPQKDVKYVLSANAAGYGPADHLRIFPRGPAGTAVNLGTVRLPLANGFVSGVVVDAQGAPAARVPVVINEYRRTHHPTRHTATNERGEFAITRVCRGPAAFEAKFGDDAGFLKTRLPARNVRIAQGKDFVDTVALSILNTAPPQLTDLCPYLLGAQTDGIPLLLCLVDIGQLSSRQCLTDLARKAGALADKGVVAVAVQTSKSGSKEGYALLGASSRVLPWCRVEDDFEALKPAWNIKSLPWLILTNQKHDVVAGGFSLRELESRIEAVTKAGQ